MDLRTFCRVAGVFLSLGTWSCHRDDQPAGSTAEDPSTSGTPSFGDLPPPDEPTSTSAGPSTGQVDPSPTGSTGASTSTGPDTTAASPFCGDGIIDPGEQCDLGVDNSNVGPCTNQCLDAICGDGLTWQGLEECDQGDANSWDYGMCTPKCTLGPYCGDGKVDPAHEECDLADLNGTGEANEGEAACTAACRWQARLVFVSSKQYTGALGGVSGADLKCQALAQAAGLTNPKKFRAWISDGVSSPLTKFEQIALDGLPYILRNGHILAANFTELVEDGPRTGISITEKGAAIFGQNAWTNTSAFGGTFSATNHCSEWTSSAEQMKARVGLNAVPNEQGPDWDLWRSDRQWTSALTHFCSQSARLYCFEDGADAI